MVANNTLPCHRDGSAALFSGSPATINKQRLAGDETGVL